VNPTLTIIASPQANADASGAGLPVQVRIYQLKSDAALKNAAFDEVWQKEAEILKADLVKSDEYTIFPGKTQVIPIKPSPDASRLAAVALFREPQGRDWVVSYELLAPPTKPPCPKSGANLSLWVDRMQIQDGEGRAEGEPNPRAE
jgi:type VI secretion system protein VasD